MRHNDCTMRMMRVYFRFATVGNSQGTELNAYIVFFYW